ncbi:MAG TPA: Gfo/Idh/MocA family oxidoreductase [Verrucomicrobiae bacterium]
MNDIDPLPDSNRRNFLKTTSLATLMTMMGGVELRADSATNATPDAPALTKQPPPPTVNFGVIGLNRWGQEILHELSIMEVSGTNFAPVVAICDTYKHALRKAGEDYAPNAKHYEDYKQLLADPNVEAVVVATPTGTHREIALAALAAGKHVYCEAPLANSIDDAKAIVKAARDAMKLVFQAGLQERSHPQRNFLIPYIRGGMLGTDVIAKAQWHQFDSWRQSAPTPEREEALNWRLSKQSSIGLLGEAGVHLIDVASWFLRHRPRAVTGFSSLVFYNDGRDVPDTVQAVFEFPKGVKYMLDCTLCTSFDDVYELYYGTDSTVMCRDSKAWQFKEAGSPLGGWEVYARKDKFYKESGIMLIANGSHQTALLGDAATTKPYDNTPLYYSLQSFAKNVGSTRQAVKDFIDLYGESDTQALQDSINKLQTSKFWEPAATWQDGYEATVMAIKANEAAVNNERITLEKEMFEI